MKAIKYTSADTREQARKNKKETRTECFQKIKEDTNSFPVDRKPRLGNQPRRGTVICFANDFTLRLSSPFSRPLRFIYFSHWHSLSFKLCLLVSATSWSIRPVIANIFRRIQRDTGNLFLRLLRHSSISSHQNAWIQSILFFESC